MKADNSQSNAIKAMIAFTMFITCGGNPRRERIQKITYTTNASRSRLIRSPIISAMSGILHFSTPVASQNASVSFTHFNSAFLIGKIEKCR